MSTDKKTNDKAVNKTEQKKRPFKLTIAGRLESSFYTAGNKVTVELTNNKTKQVVKKEYNIKGNKGLNLSLIDNETKLVIGKEWDIKFDVK